MDSKISQTQIHPDAYTAGQLRNLLRVLPRKTTERQSVVPICGVRVSQWYGVVLHRDVDLYASSYRCTPNERSGAPPRFVTVAGCRQWRLW